MLKGAFVSRWEIDRRTLEVVKGEDFTRRPAVFWGHRDGEVLPGTTVWSVTAPGFPRPGALAPEGTLERIYMNGEEVSQDARGADRHRPHAGEVAASRLRRMAYENAVASPHSQRRRW